MFSARTVGIVLLTALFSVSASAITWFPQDFTCPVDNEKNTFMVVGSYGSYIYSYPEKYQWVFWPRTDSPTYYSCKKCHLTLYMWDWESFPKDKIADVKKVLAGISMSGPHKKYTDIPILERMEIMSKIYPVLNKDEQWWEDFYRTQGFHYGKAGDTKRAEEVRRRSLETVQKWLADPKSDQPKKILLYISASMKHFLGDDQAALADLETALKTKLVAKDVEPGELKQREDGFNERLTDYISKIKSEKDKPRLFDKGRLDSH